jgi:alanine dehydrogenase
LSGCGPTATHALANATLPYVLALADHGAAGAVAADPGLRLGVNVAGGLATHPAVARSIGEEPVAIETALGA